VANQVEVLILQHPLEVAQAKGSARLLQLSLQQCHLQVGEHFEPAVLNPAQGVTTRHTLLLYPAPAAGHPDSQSIPPLPDPGWLHTPERLRLVVLDATWRKSRKLLHLHPWLQQLPRYSLHEPPPSRYTIRKAQQPLQRSTLEATCLALQALEGAPERYAPLLQAFTGFVGLQLALAAQGRAGR
jgi:DTW domain-containing protein